MYKINPWPLGIWPHIYDVIIVIKAYLPSLKYMGVIIMMSQVWCHNYLLKIDSTLFVMNNIKIIKRGTKKKEETQQILTICGGEWR